MQSTSSRKQLEDATAFFSDTPLQQNQQEEIDEITEAAINKHLGKRTDAEERDDYERLKNAATFVRTRGKAAFTLIKRLRTERDINIFTHRLESPLHIATQLGAARFASLIIRRGADVNAQDERGYTAIHYAIEANSVKMVRQLVQHGANVNVQNSDGNTPMHLIVNTNNVELGRELAKSKHLDTSIVNNNNVDPLTLSVISNQVRIMSLLLNISKAYNKQDIQGKTPLHWACMMAGPCIIHKLLDKTEENIKDVFGDTPLSVAVKINNERAVDMLWNTRHFDAATRDSQGNSTLHMACHHDNRALIKLIINLTSDVDTPNSFGETPLHHACSTNNVTAIQELKLENANRNAWDNKHQTPLIVAAINNNTAAARAVTSQR